MPQTAGASVRHNWSTRVTVWNIFSLQNFQVNSSDTSFCLLDVRNVGVQWHPKNNPLILQLLERCFDFPHVNGRRCDFDTFIGEGFLFVHVSLNNC